MKEKIVPCRGLLLVKKVEVEDNIRGIIMAPEVIDKWTAQQVEILAVGKPQLFEEIPDRLFNKCWTPVFRNGKRYWQRKAPMPFKKGDWCLIYPRTLSPTGERDLYMVTFDNVMGVFSC
jgi:hypothetical protein